MSRRGPRAPARSQPIVGACRSGRPGETRSKRRSRCGARAGSEPAVNASVEGLEALFDGDPGALLVAEDDGRLVGTLVAAWDGWRGAMYRLAVLPSQRRRGVALALVEAGERRLQALGARRIALVALHDHEDAVGFWAAAGYAADGRITRFVKTLG